MSDPRPLARVVQGGATAALSLLAWWWLQGPTGRTARLAAIWHQEHATAFPPSAFFDQLDWLVQHRLGLLWGLGMLLGLALLLGSAEGWSLRRRDTLAGYRLRLWTIGLVSAVLVLVLGAAYLVLPWPLPAVWVAVGFTVCVGLVSFLMTFGCPWIP